MKSLKHIREASGGKEAYQKFFNSLLKRFGVKSPSELEGDKKKQFYDAIDKGWDGDNEAPEKNERHDDPDNLDPDTTHDSDEDMADKAASKITERTKLKAGKGKLGPRDAIDIDYMGDKRDIKFDSTKWKITMKGKGDGQLFVSGEKQKIIAWLTSDDYGMDDEDIEDLFPELLESRFPKALSVIREWSGDAETQRKKKRRFEAAEKIAIKQNEKMAMCEHCGKVHEEGACGESMEMGEASRYSKDLRGPAKEVFQKALDTIRKERIRGDRDQAAVVDKIKGVLNDRDVRQIKMALQYEGTVTEMNFDRMLGIKGKKKNTAPKDTEDAWDKYKRLSKNKDGSKKLTATQQAKIHRIADKNRGDMQNAMKEIERLSFFAQGIKDDPYVLDVLRRYNESVNESSVDRRTKGFKEALKRQEASKIKREKTKDKKAKKKDQAELDARYEYDGDVDTVIAAASKIMMGQGDINIDGVKAKPKKEDAAANSVDGGGVDLAPDAGKKKKKELLARRGY